MRAPKLGTDGKEPTSNWMDMSDHDSIVNHQKAEGRKVCLLSPCCVHDMSGTCGTLRALSTNKRGLFIRIAKGFQSEMGEL